MEGFAQQPMALDQQPNTAVDMVTSWLAKTPGPAKKMNTGVEKHQLVNVSISHESTID